MSGVKASWVVNTVRVIVRAGSYSSCNRWQQFMLEEGFIQSTRRGVQEGERADLLTAVIVDVLDCAFAMLSSIVVVPT